MLAKNWLGTAIKVIQILIGLTMIVVAIENRELLREIVELLRQFASRTS